MADNILPAVVRGVPHLKAIDDTMADRLAAINWDEALVYLIDTVSAAALPLLAEQFDVTGYSGYKLATTDAQRRAVIKQAIELKRYIGTVWAVKQAMIAVGYGAATLVQSSGTVGDGHDWARFKVTANLGNTQGLNSNTPQELTALINEYKNARSVLESIEYIVGMTEALPEPTEALNIDVHVDLSDTMSLDSLFFDGSWIFDGTHLLRPGVEDLQAQ